MAIPFLPRRDENPTEGDEPSTAGAEQNPGNGEMSEGDDPAEPAAIAASQQDEISTAPEGDDDDQADNVGETDSASVASSIIEDGEELATPVSGFGFGSAAVDAEGGADAGQGQDDSEVETESVSAATPEVDAFSTDRDVDMEAAEEAVQPGLPEQREDLASIAPAADGGGAVPTTADQGVDSDLQSDVGVAPTEPDDGGEPVQDPQPVRVTDPAPDTPPGGVVPNLGTDHVGGLLGQRARDVLRPGGGQQVARPARVLAMANQKGGVGKTTTAINLGAALAELGSRVLLIDMDPQGSLGVGLGADPHARQQTIYNLLLVDGTTVDEVLVRTNVENLHLLPANIDLAAAELLLVQEVAREQALRRVVEHVQYRYDFVLIDCPPSLGLLTINGLTAAEGVIVPLEAEYFALRGMSLLMQTLEKVQARLNPQLKLEGIVATMFDGRTLHAREVLERVRSAFGDAVFKTTINKTIRFAEAPVAGEPILSYRPRSKGSDAYRDLAREVLAREPSS